MKRSDKKTKNRHMQITRHIIQVIAFIAFPELFITVYVSIKDIVTSIIGGTFSFAGNASSLILTSGILLVTALWGRFFCGYLCAFGAVSELMYSVFNKRIIKKTLMPTSVDSKLKWVKTAPSRSPAAGSPPPPLRFCTMPHCPNKTAVLTNCSTI